MATISGDKFDANTQPQTSNDTPANPAATTATTNKAIKTPPGNCAATAANLATDVTDGQQNSTHEEVKEAAPSSKPSNKVRNSSLVLPSTRSGLVRKELGVKRLRTTTKSKCKPMNGDPHATLRTLLSSSPFAITTTNSFSSTTNSVTSQMSALAIAANNNPPQLRSLFSSTPNSFVPTASSSTIFDQGPHTVDLLDGRRDQQHLIASVCPSDTASNRMSNIVGDAMSQNKNTSGVNASDIFWNANSVKAGQLLRPHTASSLTSNTAYSLAPLAAVVRPPQAAQALQTHVAQTSLPSQAHVQHLQAAQPQPFQALVQQMQAAQPQPSQAADVHQLQAAQLLPPQAANVLQADQSLPPCAAHSLPLQAAHSLPTHAAHSVPQYAALSYSQQQSNVAPSLFDFNKNNHSQSQPNLSYDFYLNNSNPPQHSHYQSNSYNSQEPFTSHRPAINTSAADITLSTSHVAARHAISKDLPIFSGKPEDWPIFITNYMQSTERCGFTDQENLIRLQNCLRGAALDAVRGNLMMPNTVNFAIETLRMLYGRPEIIHQALQRNLRNQPTVRKEKLDTLINFALAVQNYRTTMQAMGLSDYLNDPMLLAELVEKLPADLKLDWGKYRISLNRINIVCFDNWLFNLATCASQVTTFTPYAGEVKSEKKERVFVHDVIDGDSSYTQPYECLKCQSNHRLFECPELLALGIDERWNFIRSNKLCIRCFKKHHIKRCNLKRKCGIDDCKMPHNTLLHRSQQQQQQRQQQQQQQNSSNQAVLFHAKDKVLFKYIPVTLFGNGYSLNTYALIDEGASCTLIESELAEQLGLDGPTGELCLQWTGEITQKDEQSKTVSVHISGRKHESKLLLNNVRTIKKLDLPVQTLTKSQIDNCEHLKNLPILPYSAAKARILIGLDNAKLCVALEIRENANDELIATRTRIGWGVYGRRHGGNSTNQRILHLCSCSFDYEELDESMKNYFSLEAVGVQVNQNPLKSKEEERAKAIMENTTKYLKDEKRWETGLLWKYDNIRLPPSFSMAKRRLVCLESKMQRDEQLNKFLTEKIREYEKNGYVRKLNTDEIPNDNTAWYIPIFTVTNKNKNKTRIVWDAAAAVENTSLNSVLLKGPDLLKSLVGILVRFRERPVAICGDIREMFHQVRVRKEDQRFQLFLWRDGDPSKPIEVYVMTVMTFGASCSPSLANYIKNRNAERFIHKHPKAVQAIVDNTFVDDWLQSADTEEEMLELARVIRSIHQDGGFEMRNWLSNSHNVLKGLDRKNVNLQKVFQDPEGKFEKVLGMWWLPTSDELTFFGKFDASVFDEDVRPTKRGVLRVIMTIFDPLGLLGHFVIYAKILLQDIWRSRVGWDEPIQPTENDKWWTWIRVLKNVSTVRVPRCYPLASRSGNVQLHIFVDASIDAYAAVAFLRAEYNNEISCSIIASKTRVAPLKPISVPKMELMAAILGLRLCNFCCEETSLPIKRRVFWTDSKDVLYWIRSDSRKFHQFVAVRIGEILEESDVSEWRWVPSSQNVADDATKWKGEPDLEHDSRWFNGSAFLASDESSWPKSEFSNPNVSHEIIHHTSQKKSMPPFLMVAASATHFSRWEKLRRCQMIIFKFLCRMITPDKTCPDLKPFIANQSMEVAEFYLLAICQYDVYYQEIEGLKNNNHLSKKHTLYKLSPYVDEYGLLRIKGRIDAIEGVPISVKRPIILPKKHVITNLIIDYYHRKYHHQHNEIIVNEIRQLFWIFGLRAAVRAVSKSCPFCKIRRAIPEVPAMGELPIERLASYTRPFYYTGVDYFGPIDIVIGRRREKRWGVVFTCMTVRAVHLEIAPSLSTDSFLLVFKQFICRRGAPRKILSDNATNFRGASRVLKEEVEKISSSELEREYPTIEWTFIPPASPHMGGVWERMVRSVKSVLMDILPNRGLREEQLRAAMADVENILNTRPLTYVPLESPDGEALTPNHFLIGSSSGIRERADPQNSGIALSKNFRLSNMIANEFWKRWIREYLPCLTRRTKWHDSAGQQISVGDIVIIVDDNAKRNEWMKGVVVEVHRGKDGSVRSAVVKTQHGPLTRPVVKLAKLDLKM